MKKLLIFLSVILFFNCKHSESTADNMLLTQIIKITDHPGKKLMEINCYACHNPSTGHDERIAPPMIAIKKHYISKNISKKQFIADIQEWIKMPSEEKSKMPGAIRNFGLMPYAPFPEETIAQIADYMFDHDIDQPEWFEDHFNKESGKGMGRVKGKGMMMKQGQLQNSDSNYEDVGLKYALSTKTQLGKNLMGAINNRGTKQAVTFCNERANALTDSMARIHNANIKRVSDKPRNQNNKANASELGHIETFKHMLSKKQEVEAIVEERGNRVNFYYPITTNSMCLQCHGTPDKEITSETYKTIKGLYPNDKAIGYDVNQVRGIWSISFNK